MSDQFFLIYFGIGVVAALIAFFISDPFDPRWPDETARWPQMMFAFVFWPVAVVAVLGAIFWAAWSRRFY